MKKPLLFAALSLAFYGNSQMTQANEASIGTTVSMFLCDSFTVNLDAVTGTGVTWDYTNLAGFENEFRDVSVVDATTTTNASSFPGSVTAITVGSILTSYYSSTSSDRTSQGFVFTEQSLGDVIAEFSTDEQIVANYPMAYGSSVNDAFAGNLDYLGGQTAAATGNSYASIDGEGTLNLPNAVSLTNVLRYKLVDTSYATITFPINLGNMEFIRRQYEYYDYASSNLPVFIHTTIKVQNVGAPQPLSEESLVLSAYAPAGYVSTTELDGIDFAIYPNPATDVVTISGNLSDKATATIIDQSGRVVLSTALTTGSAIDISALDTGAYLVRVEDKGLITTKSIVKK